MSNEKKKLSPFIIGLALFSMFFGSGNLIFTLFVGQLAESHWIYTAIGFLLTGVLMPFIGIIAMVLFRGNYEKFFASFGKAIGFIVPLLLLTVWIPFGSAPRCVTLSYASLATYLPLPPEYIFNLFYCALLAVVVMQRSKILDILGKYLTPLLLLCLGTIAIKGIFFPAATMVSSTIAPAALFTGGMAEGYNTMDLIASFFFSASIITLLAKACEESGQRARVVLQSGVIGVSLLGIVYFMLIYLAALHAPLLAGVPKDRLLAHLSMLLLGPKVGIIAVVAVSLACFTTSVALTFVYADFIGKYINDDERKITSSLLTLTVTYLMSNFGLKGITALTAPILQVFYPMLMVMIVINITKIAYQHVRKKKQTPVLSNN